MRLKLSSEWSCYIAMHYKETKAKQQMSVWKWLVNTKTSWDRFKGFLEIFKICKMEGSIKNKATYAEKVISILNKRS